MLNKVRRSRPVTSLQRDSNILGFLQFCKIFFFNYFTKHLQITPSDIWSELINEFNVNAKQIERGFGRIWKEYETNLKQVWNILEAQLKQI